MAGEGPHPRDETVVEELRSFTIGKSVSNPEQPLPRPLKNIKQASDFKRLLCKFSLHAHTYMYASQTN